MNEATVKVTGVPRRQLIGTDFSTRTRHGRATSMSLPTAMSPTVESYKLGANSYVSKPIELDEFIEADPQQDGTS